MSIKIKMATITVDDIARESFPQSKDDVKGYLDTIERLQRNLQDKGDDPRYERLIFAADGQDRYLEIDKTHVILAGVFPRVLGVRFAYGQANRGLRNGLVNNMMDTLVVVDSESMANMWETELTQLEYHIRKL